MAKKKRSTKGSLSGAEDGTSVASTSTLASIQDLPTTSGGDDDFADPFERCLEALYEKRSSTRVAALAGLVSLLERSYCNEDCHFRKDTMTSQLLSSLRKGTPPEAALAVRALGLHLLTLGLGPELDSVLEEVTTALQRTATAAGKDAELRARALEAMSLLTFAAEEDQNEIDSIMSGLSTVASEAGSSTVTTAALKAWTLLLSCCPSWRLDGQFCSRSLQSLSSHLEEKNVDQRNAAGEAVALLFTMAGLSGPSNEGTDDDSGAEDGGSGLDGVVNRMKDLAVNRGDAMRRSKRDRASLKSSFRGYYKAVEGGRMSFERFKMRDGRVIVIDTMEGQIQLDAFRDFLGPGLQIQLEENTLLHDVFGIDSDHNDSVQQLAEMGFRTSRTPDTAVQKSRSKNRSKEQAQKAFHIGTAIPSSDE